jgi:hypothetical protein
VSPSIRRHDLDPDFQSSRDFLLTVNQSQGQGGVQSAERGFGPTEGVRSDEQARRQLSGRLHKFITPHVEQAGRNDAIQIRRQVYLLYKGTDSCSRQDGHPWQVQIPTTSSNMRPHVLDTLPSNAAPGGGAPPIY